MTAMTLTLSRYAHYFDEDAYEDEKFEQRGKSQRVWNKPDKNSRAKREARERKEQGLWN